MGSMKRYMQFVRPYKWDIVITFLIGVVKFLIPMATPFIMKIVIDDIIGAEELTKAQQMEGLAWCIGIVAILFFVVRPSSFSAACQQPDFIRHSDTAI